METAQLFENDAVETFRDSPRALFRLARVRNRRVDRVDLGLEFLLLGFLQQFFQSILVFQFAVSVRSSVNTVDPVTFSVSLYQPSKSYPLAVGTGYSAIVPFLGICIVSTAQLPSPASKVTVTNSLQCA